MKKFLFFLIVLFAISGCMEKKDLYRPPEMGESQDYSLTDKINISSNLPENTRCLLFTSDPTGEASPAEPVMIAYAPFNFQIPVAKAVDKLYTYVNGEIKAHNRGEIVINAPVVTKGMPMTTKAEGDEEPLSHTKVELDAPFITAINNYYPEKLVNVFNGDLGTSSDLVAYDGVKEIIKHPDGTETEVRWEDTKIWITYVTDGGFGFPGSLWYYTYKVDANGVPTTPLNDLKYTKIFDKARPRYAYPLDGPGKRVYLGEFEPGTRIGFAYLGETTTNDRVKHSTPYYNAQKYSGTYDDDDDDGNSWTNKYNGMTVQGNCIDYKDNAYTSGVIRMWEYNGKKYATLGMENRLPSETYWDGDFNDMICLIEAGCSRIIILRRAIMISMIWL